jgi:hypothetical protein
VPSFPLVSFSSVVSAPPTVALAPVQQFSSLQRSFRCCRLSASSHRRRHCLYPHFSRSRIWCHFRRFHKRRHRSWSHIMALVSDCQLNSQLDGRRAPRSNLAFLIYSRPQWSVFFYSSVSSVVWSSRFACCGARVFQPSCCCCSPCLHFTRAHTEIHHTQRLQPNPPRTTYRIFRLLGFVSQPELGGNRIVLNATKQAPAPQASKILGRASQPKEAWK